MKYMQSFKMSDFCQYLPI